MPRCDPVFVALLGFWTELKMTLRTVGRKKSHQEKKILPPLTRPLGLLKYQIVTSLPNPPPILLLLYLLAFVCGADPDAGCPEFSTIGALRHCGSCQIAVEQCRGLRHGLGECFHNLGMPSLKLAPLSWVFPLAQVHSMSSCGPEAADLLRRLFGWLAVHVLPEGVPVSLALVGVPSLSCNPQHVALHCPVMCEIHGRHGHLNSLKPELVSWIFALPHDPFAQVIVALAVRRLTDRQYWDE
jgi:hypothetical protein